MRLLITLGITLFALQAIAAPAEEAMYPLYKAFPAALPDRDQLQATIGELLTTLPTRKREVICEAMDSYPQAVGRVTSASLRAGASSADVAAQCRCEPAMPNIPELVSAAVSENATLSVILETCLPSVSAAQAVQVIVAGLEALEPTEREGFIELSVEILEDNGLDGDAILVDSLIEGEFLASDELGADCVGDCLRPLAEELVQNATGDDGFGGDGGGVGGGPGSGPGNGPGSDSALIDTIEPPASGS